VNYTIIIPCFNESNRFPKKDVKNIIERYKKARLLFVNDCSSDNTKEILESMTNEKISFINLPINKGKAEAIRAGVLHLKKNEYDGVISYLDADMSTPLDDACNIIEKYFKEDEKKLFLLGSRVMLLGRDLKRTFLRHHLGRVFATIVSIMLDLPVYDSQCGFKAFHSSLCYHLFKDPFCSKWFFDVELLFRQKKYENLKLFEVPLERWHHVEDSRLGLVDFLKTPFELFKIYYNYKDY
jgi:dolichyl-phosphate beta-glucosyltransferase